MITIAAALVAAAQPAAASGFIPVVTAVGGVAVSIFTVYKNAQKQAQFTGENTGHIQSLSEQIGMLNSQIIELKSENAGLTAELRLVREAHEADRNRPRHVDYNDDDDEYVAPKKRRPRHENEDDEDYQPPRRKRTPEQPPPTRRKKK